MAQAASQIKFEVRLRRYRRTRDGYEVSFLLDYHGSQFSFEAWRLLPTFDGLELRAPVTFTRAGIRAFPVVLPDDLAFVVACNVADQIPDFPRERH